MNSRLMHSEARGFRRKKNPDRIKIVLKLKLMQFFFAALHLPSETLMCLMNISFPFQSEKRGEKKI